LRLLRKRIATLAASAMLAATVFTGLPLPKAGAAEPPPTAEIAMVNPGFEAAVGQDGKIPGWNVNYTAKDDSGGKVTHSVSSAAAKSGSKSLNLFDNSNTHTVELVSDKYQIEAGKEYTLNGWINPNEPAGRKDGSVGGTIQLRFYDASNTEVPNSRVTNNYSSTSTQGEFTRISVSKAAPAEAKYVAIAVIITAYWTGNTYFDDFQITYPAPTPDSGTVALVNAGFEEALGQDDKITGWNANYTVKDDVYGKVSHSISSTVAKTGSKSLNLFDNSNTYAIELVSDKYQVVPGKEYTLSAWINPNEPAGRKDGSVGGTIQVRFYDASNNEVPNSRVTNNYSNTSTQGKFTQISVSSKAAPVEAKYVSVAILITAYWTGNTYFDDVELKYTTPVTTPTPTPTATPTPTPTATPSPTPTPDSGTVAVKNSGFEEEVGQDSKIPGWNVNYTAADDADGKATHSVSGTVAKTGSKSLNLFDNSNKYPVELVSDKYPVISGKVYTLSAWINPNEPQGRKDGSVGGTIQLRFYDANNNELTENRVANNYNDTKGIGKFTQISVTSNAVPAGAKYVSMALLITGYWTGNTYFDDVELKYTTPVTTPTPTPTPTLPPEDLSEKIIDSDDLKAVVSIPVPNAGFERGMTNGSITSWEKWAASSADIKHELAADKKYSGNSSLKLTDTTTSDNAVIQSEKLQVKPGVEYKASAMQYVASSPAPAGNGATFLLRFFNAQNVQVGADILQHSSTPVDLWFKAEVKGIAPNDAAYARLFALVNKGSTAVAYFDDFLFTYERQLMQLEIKSPEYAAKDDTFTVQLGSRYAESLTGAELSLAFDTNVLELVDVTAHPDFGAIGNTSLTKEENNGVLNIHIARTDSGVVNGAVGIVYVTFKALDGQGDAILSLKAGSVLKSLKGSVIESKTFTSDVKTRTTLKLYKFDVNHDGIVNLVDLLLVAKNIGKTSDGVMVYYDLNGDKNIDIIDVGLLAQALADL